MVTDKTSTHGNFNLTHPQTYTSTPLSPVPTSVPMLSISSLITTALAPSDERLPPPTESQDAPVSIPKHCHITPMPVLSSESPLPSTSSPSSGPTSKSVSEPIIVIPEHAIPAEAYPEHLNWPGGGKDYLCHLCTFRHSNLDCILTHVRITSTLQLAVLAVVKDTRMWHLSVNMAEMYILFK